MGLQHRKMQGLFPSHLYPVAVIGLGQIGKTPGGIERQVDGIEFNMRDGMHQCRVAGHGMG